MSRSRSAPGAAARGGGESTVPCMELTEGEARYLLALRDLNAGGTPPSQAAVARKVGVSHPTALEMIRRLRALDLVSADSLTLTPSGTSAALVLTSRRYAARVLAHEVLGLDDEQSAAEAEALATSLSPVLARRLVAWRARRGEPAAVAEAADELVAAKDET